jgi:hypothetical protein
VYDASVELRGGEHVGGGVHIAGIDERGYPAVAGAPVNKPDVPVCIALQLGQRIAQAHVFKFQRALRPTSEAAFAGRGDLALNTVTSVCSPEPSTPTAAGSSQDVHRTAPRFCNAATQQADVAGG